MIRIDSPAEYDDLSPAKRAALAAWIEGVMRPSGRYSKNTSYALKHCFEDYGFYVTNGQFKGAMLAAGYKPKNPGETNWTFKVRPHVRGLGVAPTLGEATGYVLPKQPISAGGGGLQCAVYRLRIRPIPPVETGQDLGRRSRAKIRVILRRECLTPREAQLMRPVRWTSHLRTSGFDFSVREASSKDKKGDKCLTP